jgi:heparan-alpha-glucosaminide N-acetyltransferase
MTFVNTVSSRINAIDILRAIIMVLMIFVNDLWSLTNVPVWLEHTQPNEDGMGLSDIVFPAFLFIVGMSLPFAIMARRKKGDRTLQVVVHIVSRSFALIVMGLFLVNGESINETATGISRSLWNVLACVSFILIWNSYPPTFHKTLMYILKCIGVFVLVVLGLNYQGGSDNLYTFSIHWWGILGLIGWSYLVSALLVLAIQLDFFKTIYLWCGWCILCLALHTEYLNSEVIHILFGPIQNGGSVLLTVGGVVISLLYLRYKERTHGLFRFSMISLTIAFAFLLAGYITHKYWIISKIWATPPWLFVCSSITIFLFLITLFVADVLKKDTLFSFIKPAGTNTLTCYLLPYFFYAIFYVWFPLELPEWMIDGVVGLGKSFLFALIVTWIAGWCQRLSIQIKI